MQKIAARQACNASLLFVDESVDESFGQKETTVDGHFRPSFRQHNRYYSLCEPSTTDKLHFINTDRVKASMYKK